MIPLRDVIPCRTRPLATLGLMAGHLMAFLALLACPATDSWPFLALLPMVSRSWLHLCANVAALWVFGGSVEDRVGHGRYVALYAVCGVAASASGWVAGAPAAVLMAGAGGAVAGVIGANVMLFPRSLVLVLVPTPAGLELVEVPALIVMGFWLLAHAVGTIGALAAIGAHPSAALWLEPMVGGAAGALVVLVLRQPERLRVEWWDGV
mgnify:CR=1 FL=1